MLIAKHGAKVFEIVKDLPDVGAYLYVYEDAKCVEDHLQDDIEMCIKLAFEDFGVPRHAWREGCDLSSPEI